MGKKLSNWLSLILLPLANLSAAPLPGEEVDYISSEIKKLLERKRKEFEKRKKDSNNLKKYSGEHCNSDNAAQNLNQSDQS